MTWTWIRKRLGSKTVSKEESLRTIIFASIETSKSSRSMLTKWPGEYREGRKKDKKRGQSSYMWTHRNCLGGGGSYARSTLPCTPCLPRSGSTLFRSAASCSPSAFPMPTTRTTTRINAASQAVAIEFTGRKLGKSSTNSLTDSWLKFNQFQFNF